ncbi:MULTISPECIES: rod shape-determining protein [unclassified Sporosarcina]|uniref:rod shape-determining protein n=1 Tax=unclassified Sporosarcina TaxID=2647733 RepID=UPI000C16EF56|nr:MULTISPECIES: rod shape-determining protein [unclassified Sporosarcina]PIC99858.1 rod shape-determining protein [Sporosarcina sp. P29]PID04448.1 rod shape-determining protein [Sporosarcina sp. P30]PID07631.1 rod shape-determining protein [Sporosarcina sp. P31]PID12300.1 rod shape-determining protein [Sporosarcina sp. P32b]
MFSKEIGIDLGTANVLIYVKDNGLVINEQAVIAIDKRTDEPVAFGNEAYQMIGRSPEHIQIIRPMKVGNIADFEMARVLIRHFLEKALGKSLRIRPHVTIGCKADTTRVEKSVIRQVMMGAGAKQVVIEEESKVAAIGAGIDISKPSGNMIVDLGAGTTDASVLSMGEIVSFKKTNIGGLHFDQCIIQHIRKKHNVYIGEKTAEQVKKDIGLVQMGGVKPGAMNVHGSDLATGIPKTIEVTAEEIHEALRLPIGKIVETTRDALEETLPELAADIAQRGIILIGGGAWLPGIDTLLSEHLQVPVFIAENPLTCIVEGTGLLMDSVGKNSTRII